MKSPESRWSAESSQRFSDHEDYMRGYVRYEITRRNLQATLGEFLDSPRRAIDIGGGRGSDAGWLASLNTDNQVILVEPDKDSIAQAADEYRDAIETVKGDSVTALRKYAERSFDLVLSHGVLMYMEDPQTELNRIVRLIRPGGYISLLNAGLLGKLNRYQQKSDKLMVDRLHLSGYYTNNMNQKARAFLPQELEKMIQSAGLDVVDWFGVRIKSDEDNRRVEDVPLFHRNRLVNEELRLSRDKSTRPQGQMLHFIARKNT